jgi:uncharacterized protein (DUF2252 family)
LDLLEATKEYEGWVARHIPLVREDLDLKHKRMAEAAFPFLRATFYRWVQLWRETCADLATGPEVLAVGDLHIENFGTWRDAEGRLVWGINDFDEACRMPYAIDLVRLAASAVIARREQKFEIAASNACEALLEGYAEGIDNGGKAFVLEENHRALREMTLGVERDPVRFWSKMNSWPDCHTAPSPVLALMKAHLPSPDLPFRVVHRVAGLGSLGRQRYVALAMWRGGMVAREAKALLPSAWEWACGKPQSGPARSCCEELARASTGAALLEDRNRGLSRCTGEPAHTACDGPGNRKHPCGNARDDPSHQARSEET